MFKYLRQASNSKWKQWNAICQSNALLSSQNMKWFVSLFWCCKFKCTEIVITLHQLPLSGWLEFIATVHIVKCRMTRYNFYPAWVEYISFNIYFLFLVNIYSDLRKIYVRKIIVLYKNGNLDYILTQRYVMLHN